MDRRDIPIPTPCRAAWDNMTAEATKRWCGECEKHVHDLSAMSSDEARALLSSSATEGLCVRYLCDTSGALVFQPESSPRLVAPGRLARLKRYVGAAAAVALPMSLTACMGAYVPPPPKPSPALAPTATPSAPVAAPSAAPAASGVAKPIAAPTTLR